MRYLVGSSAVLIWLGLWALSGCIPASRGEQAPPAQSPNSVETPPDAPANEPVANEPVATGCGAAAPGAPLQSVSVNGRERSFILHVPASYNPNQEHELIFAFHGHTNSNAQAREYFGLESAFPNALIIYPSGIQLDTGFSWTSPGDAPENLRDYALFDELLRVTQLMYCVDASRVYAVGHSLGGYFAADLGCARATSVRAVALLGAGVQGSSCAAPVAAMILHNPNDSLVPVTEGEKARDLFVANLGTPVKPVSEANEPLRTFGCSRYSGTVDAVLWCPHRFDYAYDGAYYPHTWPAETSQAIASFFNSLLTD